jgi:hypothetical protein
VVKPIEVKFDFVVQNTSKYLTILKQSSKKLVKPMKFYLTLKREKDTMPEKEPAVRPTKIQKQELPLKDVIIRMELSILMNMSKITKLWKKSEKWN